MGNKFAYPEVDLSGKVVLVTGGNTGIGYETAKGLARLGAHTFIACRSKERAESAIERIKDELSQIPKGAPSQASNSPKASEKKRNIEDGEEDSSENADTAGEGQEVRIKDEDRQQSTQATAAIGKEVKVEYIPLDLASFQSTKECVRIFKERDLPLHILVNNAGVAGIPYTTTGDNLEAVFQINHLGPMLFTLELLPVLLDTAASSGDVRILFVSSTAHYFAESFNPDQLNRTEEEQTGRMKLYSNSKLYNVMTGFCLQRRLQNNSVTVSSVHPGYVRTGLSLLGKDRKLLNMFQNAVLNVVGINSVEGAVTSLNCAVNPELNSQQHFYYDSCKTKVSSADSRNELFQEQLWENSFKFMKDHLSPDILERYGPNPQEQAVMSSEVNDIPSAELDTNSKYKKSDDAPEVEVANKEQENGLTVGSGAQEDPKPQILRNK